MVVDIQDRAAQSDITELSSRVGMMGGYVSSAVLTVQVSHGRRVTHCKPRCFLRASDGRSIAPTFSPPVPEK